MKSRDATVGKRASMLHNLHQGYTPDEVAAIHAVSSSTSYNTFHRHQKEALAGFSNKAKSGRPPKADVAYRQRLVKGVEIEPHVIGLRFAVWRLPGLEAFMERETGVSLSQNCLSEVLDSEGYVHSKSAMR